MDEREWLKGVDPWIRRRVLRVVLWCLVALGFVIGLVVLGLLIAAYAAVALFLGNPEGPVVAALFVAWFAGSLAALALVFRWLYRRLPTGLRSAIETVDTEDPDDADGWGGRRDPAADPQTLLDRVAALDAQLGSRGGSPGTPDPTSADGQPDLVEERQ